MKTHLTLWITFLVSSSIFAQWEKVEIYTTGTKVTFYKDACNTSVPNTENKLTFCDSNNNLGVVEKSFGLNNRNISALVENNYNNDLVFLTQDGISINKEDGTWQNIPKYALNRSSLTSNPPSVGNAIVHSDGKIYYAHGNNFGMHWIDIETMEVGFDDVSNNYAINFVTNPITSDLYSIRNNKIIKKSSSGTISVQTLTNLQADSVSSLLFYDNLLYVVTNNAIFKINVDNYTVLATYTLTNLGVIGQLKSASLGINGNLWLAISGSLNNSGLLKFNLETLATEFIQIQNNTGFNIQFFDVQYVDNGEIIGLGNNFAGYVRLYQDNNGDLQNELIPIEDLENNHGFELIYNFNDVAVQNEKLVFSGSSASSGINQADEIIMKDLINNQWTSINDSHPGNISYNMTARFTKNAYPDKTGVWWSNAYDNILVKTFYDGTFYEQRNTPHSIDSGVIVDSDESPVIVRNKVKKLYPPAVFELNAPTQHQSFDLVKRYKDQIWAWDDADNDMVIYRNNQMVGSFNIDGLPSSLFNFDIDENKVVWFAKNQFNNLLNVYGYDSETETLTTYPFTYTNSLGSLNDIVTGPGYVAFIYSQKIIIFDGTNFFDYDSDQFPQMRNMVDAVTDENGGLHVLCNDPSSIISINNILTNNPSFDFLGIEGSAYSITPYITMYRPNTLVLDYENNFWVHGSKNWMKIALDNSLTPYLPQGIEHGLTGKVYLDKNENNQFDQGEGYPNQKVTLVENDYNFTTFTDVYGKFFFTPNTLGQNHRVTLTSFNPHVIPSRVQSNEIVTTIDSDTDLGEFQLKPLNVDGLMVKSSEKQGLWGFSRPGFQNAFTTAIGSISSSRTYNDLEIEYLFKNEEGSTFPLPDIADVKVYKLSPNNLNPIIQYVLIEPRSNNWSLSIAPNIYTQTELNLTPTIVQTDTEIKVALTIPQILPFETHIVQINTELFLAEATGTVVEHGLSNINGPDLGGPEDNPSPRNFNLIPREDHPDLGSPSEFNPYILPDEVYDDIPFTEPKDFYVPPPHKTKIYSAYDPNDKLVSPGIPDELNQQSIEEKWLYYTINFENKGNFSAKDVAIIDTLDINLNPHTFVMYESSHPVKTSFIPWDNKTIVKFDFKDIYLDYTDNDSEASRGFVKYWIQADENIQEGTIVENSAAIYFDQNPPIYTNVTQNKFLTLNMSTDDFVDSDDLHVRYYPNPVEEILNLSFPDNHHYDLQLYDMTGQILIEEELTNNKDYRMNLSSLKVGLYILNIVNDQGEFVSYKIIKK